MKIISNDTFRSVWRFLWLTLGNKQLFLSLHYYVFTKLLTLFTSIIITKLLTSFIFLFDFKTFKLKVLASIKWFFCRILFPTNWLTAKFWYPGFWRPSGSSSAATTALTFTSKIRKVILTSTRKKSKNSEESFRNSIEFSLPFRSVFCHCD